MTKVGSDVVKRALIFAGQATLTTRNACSQYGSSRRERRCAAARISGDRRSELPLAELRRSLIHAIVEIVHAHALGICLNRCLLI